jgi:hypothetical protein
MRPTTVEATIDQRAARPVQIRFFRSFVEVSWEVSRSFAKFRGQTDSVSEKNCFIIEAEGGNGFLESPIFWIGCNSLWGACKLLTRCESKVVLARSLGVSQSHSMAK